MLLRCAQATCVANGSKNTTALSEVRSGAHKSMEELWLESSLRVGVDISVQDDSRRSCLAVCQRRRFFSMKYEAVEWLVADTIELF